MTGQWLYIVNKKLFSLFIHAKLFNFLSGAGNKVTITVFLFRKNWKSKETRPLIVGRCIQVPPYCIKLLDEDYRKTLRLLRIGRSN